MVAEVRFSRSLTVRLGAILAALLIGFAFLVGYNLSSVAELEGNQAWTQLAGSCRERAWQLLYRAQAAASAGPEARPAKVALVERQSDELASLLRLLRTGDAALAVTPPADPELMIVVERLEGVWRTEIAPRLAAGARGVPGGAGGPELAGMEQSLAALTAELEQVEQAADRRWHRQVSTLRSRQTRFAAAAALLLIAAAAIGFSTYRRLRSILDSVAGSQGAGRLPRESAGRDEIGALGAAVSRLSAEKHQIEAALGLEMNDRVLADQARESSQRRYQSIVETAIDAIVTIDELGTIESVNPAVEALFGWPSEELLGRNVKMLMPSPYRDQHDDYLAAYRSTGIARIIGIGREVVGQRKDGSMFPIELAVTEVDLGGRRVFIGVMRDISRRRRAELLAETGTLAAGIAHEIGTPMNVILGRAEHIRAQVSDPVMAHGLDVIIAQVERIARLMNQLLQITRPHPLERRATDLNRVVHDTLYVIQDRAKRRHIEVDVRLDGALPRIEVDPDRMSQLLLNLLVNAIDAMPAGGWLRVSSECLRGSPDAGDRVELKVSDTGAGIPADQIQRIFTPFFSTKGTGKGTGLGLSIVQGIVREHGGDVQVESQVGQGTTFRIQLPLGGVRRAPVE